MSCSMSLRHSVDDTMAILALARRMYHAGDDETREAIEKALSLSGPDTEAGMRAILKLFKDRRAERIMEVVRGVMEGERKKLSPNYQSPRGRSRSRSRSKSQSRSPRGRSKSQSPQREKARAKFVFMFKSADAKPGRGKAGDGERLGSSRPEAFAELDMVPRWRSVLSNFYECPSGPIPFAFNGEKLHFKTGEHLYHFLKFWKVGGEEGKKAARKFALESGSSISKGDAAAAKTAGGKSKKSLMRLSPEAMARWQNDGHYIKAQELVADAKFRSCHVAREVLLKTGDAELVHLVTRRGKPSVEERWIWLERLRDRLREEQKGRK